MRRSIHGLMGSALGLLASTNAPLLILYLLILGWIGGWIPDLDLRFKHRKSLHNIWMAGFVSAIIYIVLYQTYIQYPLSPYPFNLFIEKTLIVFSGSWMLHLFGDSLTVRGVYPLYPVSNYRFRIAKLRSSGFTVNFIGVLIALAMVFLWFKTVVNIDVYIKYLRSLTGL